MSKKFLITWDAGYGMSAEEIEADNYDDALAEAEHHCREEIESNISEEVEPNISYKAHEYTKELAEDLQRVIQ